MQNPTTAESAEALARDFTPQRHHRRIPLEVEVTIESDHNFFTGFTNNISEGGIFVATSLLKPLGTKVAFTFSLAPFPEKVSVNGVVRWIREDSKLTEDSPAGMGIQFIDLHPTVAKRIDAFISRSRDTIFYDE